MSDLFSGRANDYGNFRADYPAALKSVLANLGINSDEIIADMGSGTGLLTRILLELGAHVYGVEPNDDMRREGEKRLEHFTKFTSVRGSAENTTLDDGSITCITAGNAFHWFDTNKAREEFKRILRPSGYVLLIRTDWKESSRPSMQHYDKIISTYCIGRSGLVSDPALERETIASFFTTYELIKLDETSVLYTREQLKGRFLSTSFSPKLGHPQHESAMSDLDELFDRYAHDDKFPFAVQTTIVRGAF